MPNFPPLPASFRHLSTLLNCVYSPVFADWSTRPYWEESSCSRSSVRSLQPSLLSNCLWSRTDAPGPVWAGAMFTVTAGTIDLHPEITRWQSSQVNKVHLYEPGQGRIRMVYPGSSNHLGFSSSEVSWELDCSGDFERLVVSAFVNFILIVWCQAASNISDFRALLSNFIYLFEFFFYYYYYYYSLI